MSHAPSGSNNGISFGGAAMLVVLLLLACMIGASFAQGGPKPTPTAVAPTATPTTTNITNHYNCQTCKHDPCTCGHGHGHHHGHCHSCNQSPCCCPVRPEPTFTGRVQGFKTSTQVRCGSSFSTEMGGSSVTATGIESIANAQYLHEHALNTRSRDYHSSLRTAEVLGKPPTIVKQTVTKTVVLTVPVPSVALIPSYRVIGPASVMDAYGRYWYYATPGGWYLR